ncbi:phosphatidylinositol-specific phospholipase C/glycerophosphodiester phosphodiesterase family protein [Paenibacillus lentus]|uniref:Glycerophosphodiester phosphodiesterase n=1 Tax=Paenibacillus lentus TaxID=1338368 RepID=A0A3S8RST3_9BACL|nr:phosphatidylinositol-specific phospholipase C/glycerophosphodiester phosphodiesterase family protein [Paenibacillus lentus]AZK45984.1 glycerophosphodiester phosphodiesterase [Paenibacillus lentus]
MRQKQLFSLLVVCAIGIMLIAIPSRPSEQPFTGFREHRIIAHAMGGIEDMTYTNTKEAFMVNYEKGTRVFEVDLLLSEDDELIARHEWGEFFTNMLRQHNELGEDRYGAVWTAAEFKQAKVDGQYEPLLWEDIVELLVKYPDIYIVTDTKQIDPEEIDRIFAKIVDSAKGRDPKLLERIVPQIYNQPMLKQIKQYYPFDSIIYTLYQSQDSDREVLYFARNNGIAAVTMSESRVNEKLVKSLKRAGIPTYVHTINDKKLVSKYMKKGVYGFYSDFLAGNEVDASR